MIACPDCGSAWDVDAEPRCPSCSLSWEDVEAAAAFIDQGGIIQRKGDRL